MAYDPTRPNLKSHGGIPRADGDSTSGTEFGGVGGIITPADRGAKLTPLEALQLNRDQDPMFPEFDDERLPGSSIRVD